MAYPLRYGLSSCLRLRDGRLGLIWFYKFTGDLQPQSNARAQHTVGNSVGKKIGPLGHCLICDTHCTGGGSDGAAEQFYGLCFAHAVLKHAFFPKSNHALWG